MKLPDGARRLFSHLSVDPERDRHEVIERLLENGDRNDLSWLTRQVPDQRLVDWLRERGARRLSDRCRAFWSLVLDVPLAARSDTSRKLWPL